MMKIVGIAILFVSIILLGVSVYEKYSIRNRSIKLFTEILNSYLVELKLHRRTIIDVIKRCPSDSKYISECKKMLFSNSLYDSTVSKNVYFTDLNLSKEGVIVINNFFENCGKGSYATELNLCQNTLNALEELKKQAAESFDKLGPLSLKLCFIGAIWIVIVLI